MEKLYSKIVGTHIKSDHGERSFTSVRDVVVDPESGKMLALVVNLSRRQVIAPVDIQSWGDVIRVHGHDAIAEAGDILRVDNVMKDGVKIFQNKVYTEDGEYLGLVYDFSLDSDGYGLKRLFVAKNILGLVRYDSRIVEAKKIIEILKEKIVVKGSSEKARESGGVSVEEVAAA